MITAKTTTGWFDDRPLELATVCTRLKEAVEERENFYRLDIPSTWYPLELPQAPFCNSDMTGEELKDRNVNFIRKFAENLYYRVNNLLSNSFNPLKFGKWCDTGYLAAYDAQQTLLEELNIDSNVFRSRGYIGGGNYCHLLPFCYENMRYFHTVADVLNRCCLYPAPPVFSTAGTQSKGYVFGLDCTFDCHDFISGTGSTFSYQPDGITFYPQGASYSATLSPANPAGYRVKLNNNKVEYEYNFKASNLKIFYTPSFPLQGSFQVKMQMEGHFENIDGSADLLDEQILTLANGSTGCEISLNWCASQLAKCTGSSLQNSKKNSYANIRFDCSEILLEKENYPLLPYKYSTPKK